MKTGDICLLTSICKIAGGLNFSSRRDTVSGNNYAKLFEPSVNHLKKR